nr:helix-turn-helix domain-containing protein [Curtobacterium flaccumfaciens]
MSSLQSLRATAHPIRLRLLSLVTSSAMSAAEAARELGLSQATASYHLRVLERAGLVAVVEVVRLRGGEAKRYRHESSSQAFDPDARSDSGAEDVSIEDQLVYVEAQVEEPGGGCDSGPRGPASPPTPNCGSAPRRGVAWCTRSARPPPCSTPQRSAPAPRAPFRCR